MSNAAQTLVLNLRVLEAGSKILRLIFELSPQGCLYRHGRQRPKSYHVRVVCYRCRDGHMTERMAIVVFFVIG